MIEIRQEKNICAKYAEHQHTINNVFWISSVVRTKQNPLPQSDRGDKSSNNLFNLDKDRNSMCLKQLIYHKLKLDWMKSKKEIVSQKISVETNTLWTNQPCLFLFKRVLLFLKSLKMYFGRSFEFLTFHEWSLGTRFKAFCEEIAFLSR